MEAKVIPRWSLKMYKDLAMERLINLFNNELKPWNVGWMDNMHCSVYS